ncbi:MAG: prephenate dehydrogenase [Clostridia bacterium]|nr:prephenate dehydrogenase [Clostridia bacterium]
MTELTRDTKILIVGLGVMGGGYAKALTARGYRHIRCITKEQADIDYALAEGMIEYGTTEVDPRLIRSSELIVFALYPGTFVDFISKHSSLFARGTLITDVTGVKGNIVSRVQAMLPEGVEFISAHPMAGREKSGVEYSDAEVFKRANYIVVPTERNTREAIELCKRLGAELGFSGISELSPEAHDSMIAHLSQLTHCIAVALMGADGAEGLEKYTGDSFRDLTRIAKINDLMWSELFLENKAALLEKMDSFSAKFATLRKMIEEGDREGLRAEMRCAAERRERFDKPKK